VKVLVTGATARHVGRLDPLAGDRSDKKAYHACPHIFADACRRLGHEVEFRPVDPGESLADFARVCVFLGPLVDPQMTYVHGALAALARRPDAIAFLDDWKVGTIQSSFRRMAMRDHFYLWHSTFAASRPLRNHAFGLPIGRMIERLVGEMAEGPWKRRVVVPLHPWGDPSIIKGCPEGERTWLDYTPGLTPPVDLADVVKRVIRRRAKKKAWLLATLGTRESWVERQDLSWPVVRAGYKAVRLSQDDVMRASAGFFGSLAPKYPHARASWWRPRFIYSAWTQTVVHCDPEEGIAKEAPGLYGLSPKFIEHLTPSRLIELARAQAEFVEDRSWTWSELRAAVGGLLK